MAAAAPPSGSGIGLPYRVMQVACNASPTETACGSVQCDDDDQSFYGYGCILSPVILEKKDCPPKELALVLLGAAAVAVVVIAVAVAVAATAEPRQPLQKRRVGSLPQQQLPLWPSMSQASGGAAVSALAAFEPTSWTPVAGHCEP